MQLKEQVQLRCWNEKIMISVLLMFNQMHSLRFWYDIIITKTFFGRGHVIEIFEGHGMLQ